MHERHHSAEELEFLKQAFAKNAPFEHGGNTLNLMDSRLVQKYENVDVTGFNNRFNEERERLRKVEDRQKKELSDALVEMERARIIGRHRKERLVEVGQERDCLKRELRSIGKAIEEEVIEAEEWESVHRLRYNRAESRQEIKSQLKKRAQRISPKDSLKIHLRNKFASESRSSFTNHQDFITKPTKHRLLNQKLGHSADIAAVHLASKVKR